MRQRRRESGDLLSLWPCSGALSALQHVSYVEFEGDRDAKQCVDGWLSHSPFDVTDHLLRQAASLRHGVHRETARLSLCP